MGRSITYTWHLLSKVTSSLFLTAWRKVLRAQLMLSLLLSQSLLSLPYIWYMASSRCSTPNHLQSTEPIQSSGRLILIMAQVHRWIQSLSKPVKLVYLKQKILAKYQGRVSWTQKGLWRRKKGRGKNDIEKRIENPSGRRGRDECGLSMSLLQTRIFHIHRFWPKSRLTWVVVESCFPLVRKQNTIQKLENRLKII